jgi:hypothetical protein
MRLIPDYYTCNLSLDFTCRFIRRRLFFRPDHKEFART